MNRVLPPEQRASWARERTIYDNPPGDVAPASLPVKPVAKRRLTVTVEVDDTDTALDRVCRALTNAEARIVKVYE